MNRLTCSRCGADLGDADDPYCDPDCIECLHRDLADELAADPQARQHPSTRDDDFFGIPDEDAGFDFFEADGVTPNDY